MDNITHGLAGLAVAEVAIQMFGRNASALSREPMDRATSGWRRWAYMISFLANNIPDADLVYSMTSNLDYLLHHRGHTHTFVLGIPLGLCLMALPILWAKRSKVNWTIRQWTILWGLAIFGPILHILLDLGNIYGVHPLWPWDNRWFYGDTVFIIEPWWWVAFGAAFVFSLRSWIAKSVVLGIWLIGLGLCWALPLVPWQAALGLTLWAAGVGTLSYRLPPKRRPILGFLAASVVLVTLVGSRQSAATLLKSHLSQLQPNATIHDLALTPYPANPLCWQAFTVVTTQDNHYQLGKVVVAPFSKLFSAQSCPQLEEGLAPLKPRESMSPEMIQWVGVFHAPLEELATLKQRCHVDAALRFMRTPFWTQEWFGDLRFDRGKNAGFATLPNDPAQTSCPQWLPDWEKPRQDILLENGLDKS